MARYADAFLALAPLLGLAGYLTSHVTLSRALGPRRLVAGYLGGFAAGETVLLACSLAALASSNHGWTDGLALVVMNQLTYLALAYGYINFVLIIIASLRIRVLHELGAADKGLTKAELLEKYNARGVLSARIERLASSGRIRAEGGRFHSVPCFLLVVARVIRMAKVVLFGSHRSHGRGGPI